MKNKFLLIGSALLLCGISHLSAGEPDPKVELNTPVADLPTFRHGGHEVELNAGAMFSFVKHSTSHPELDYAIEDLRFGWMFDDVYGSNFLRGNDELIIEGFAGQVFKGPGKALGGGDLLLRHNFVQDGWKLVPFVQLGGGALDNDIYHQQAQSLVGEGFEFMLTAGAGVRYMITPHWALSLEGDYRHISNADLARRNFGLNSLGGTLGLNYFF